MTNMNDTQGYFEYRMSSRFIGELQLVFSVIILVSGIVCTVSFYSELMNTDPIGHARDLAVGYITFSVLTVFVSLSDIVFAIILISATQRISLSMSLLWRGSALATLALFGLVTISFVFMMKSATILLGFTPSLIFKPFAIWIVGGFIKELRQLENFPVNSIPPVKPRLSLQYPEMIKNTTTIFKRESMSRAPSVAGSKITTILEDS